jgi:tellurite resistance protein TerC
MSDLPAWFEIGALSVLTALLIADLALVAKRPHVPSAKESGIWVAFYVSLAIAFGIVMLFIPGGGGGPSGEFFAGWITEYSLSVDNLFVFVIIMSRFAVPAKEQQLVLMVGIIIALVLRAVFILLGAAILERFTWVFYVFGAFLIYTAIKLLKDRDHDDDYEENALVRQLRKVLPISDDYHGSKLWTRVDGKRVLTPMIIVFVAIGSTDLLFALDSIPAIFGLTRDPFIVFAANLFALMGLRQLYFLLGGLLDRLVYLPIGLAVVLGFIGVKLILEALHTNSLPFINGGEHVEWAPEIPTFVSLGVIIGVIALATVASLLKSRSQTPDAVAGPPDTSKDVHGGRAKAPTPTEGQDAGQA